MNIATKIINSPCDQLYYYIEHYIVEDPGIPFMMKNRALSQLYSICDNMEKLHMLARIYNIPLYDNDGTCLWELSR